MSYGEESLKIFEEKEFKPRVIFSSNLGLKG